MPWAIAESTATSGQAAAVDAGSPKNIAAIALGSALELRFVVQPTRTGILAGGRVLRCEPAPDGRHHLVVEFSHLRDGDRQLVARHVMHREAEQLRARREQNFEA